MFTFLLVLQALVAAALVGVILIQRSEGGGLGMGGGSPAGMLSARGAANFLTRATTGLAIAFVVLSIALAAIASVRHGGSTDIDTSLARTPNSPPSAPGTVPPADAASPAAAAGVAPTTQPRGNDTAPADVPLAQ